MTPRKITITITDSADCSKASVEMHFDPPADRSEPTPATAAACAALNGIQGASSQCKSVSITTADGRTTNLSR